MNRRKKKSTAVKRSAPIVNEAPAQEPVIETDSCGTFEVETSEFPIDLSKQTPNEATEDLQIPTPTVAEIQSKTVIQLHTMIRDSYPQFGELLSIFNRDELREAFILKGACKIEGGI